MAETWINLTDADVFAGDSHERKTIAGIKKRDDLADIVANVVEQVRDALRQGGRALGDEGTIPSGLKQRAIAIALWVFITTGVPRNEVMHTKEREKAYSDALDYLEKIAMRTIKGAGSAQIVSGVTRIASRAKTDGL